MTDTPVTVPEFVKVRQHIANLLKDNSSTQISTRIRQAENLLMAGVIDVPAVLDDLAPKPGPELPEDDEDAEPYDNGPDI